LQRNFCSTNVGPVPRRPVNWPIWSSLPLAIATLYSYPFVFVRWPITRDVPWVNLLLGAAAVTLAIAGVRRSFSRSWIARATGVVVAAATVAGVGLFVYNVLILARELPVSAHAPGVGQQAPEFTLPDLNNQPVSLTRLRTTPLGGSRLPRGVLLIFYRGYW
jgi:xanthine/uracil/vitamin C permease (AzgA family)